MCKVFWFQLWKPKDLIAGIHKCLAFKNEVIPILVLPFAHGTGGIIYDAYGTHVLCKQAVACDHLNQDP